MTALMRWRTFRTICAFACEIGVRTSRTSALVTSETCRLPMRGKAWSSRLFSQVRAWTGLRQPTCFSSTTRTAASANVDKPSAPALFAEWVAALAGELAVRQRPLLRLSH